MKRKKIYKAIDSERDYQDLKWNDPKESKLPAEFLIDIEIHLNKAKKHNYDIDYDGVMDELRKIAALAVKCGEIYGIDKRR